MDPKEVGERTGIGSILSE